MRNFNRDSRGGGRDFSRRSFNDRSRQDRQMHHAVCSECGRDCEVPFAPTGEKPVYCSDCFQKKNGGDSHRFQDRRQARPQNTDQFDSLNKKLDKIIELLTPPVKDEVKKKTKNETKTKEILTKVKLGKKKTTTKKRK